MNSRPITLDALRTSIRRLEGGYGDPALRRHIPTGLGALDRLLAGGGLPAAAVTAILTVAGAGAEPAWALALFVATGLLRGEEDRRIAGEVALIDRTGELYPPAIAALGIGLERTLFVRPARARDAPWALEEALRSPAVGLAIGEARRLPASDVRRLELAAEAGGGVGLVLAREDEAGTLGRVPVVLRARPRSGGGFAVEVARCRGSRFAERGIEVHVAADPVSGVPRAFDGPGEPDVGRASA